MPPKASTIPQSVRKKVTKARKEETLKRNEIAKSIYLVQGIDYHKVAHKVVALIKSELNDIKLLMEKVQNNTKSSISESCESSKQIAPPVKLPLCNTRQRKRSFHEKLIQLMFTVKTSYQKKYGTEWIDHEKSMINKVIKRSRDAFNKSFKDKRCAKCGSKEFRMDEHSTDGESSSNDPDLSKQKKKRKRTPSSIESCESSNVCQNSDDEKPKRKLKKATRRKSTQVIETTQSNPTDGEEEEEDIKGTFLQFQ